ncbi:MAG: hypothetical protein P1V97_08620 [Planctomycetota bacterium]|nr:hypothetical protein [Planctomycetota bacterium]
MIRKIALALFVTTLLSSGTLYANSSSDVAFLKAIPKAGKKNKKKKKVRKGEEGKKAVKPVAAPEVLWVRLEGHQLRSLRLKQKAQNRMMRRDVNREYHRFPVELTKTQKLAIRIALKIKKPLPRKVYLWVDFQNLRKDVDRSRFPIFITRSPEQFKEKNPSDPKPAGQ